VRKGRKCNKTWFRNIMYGGAKTGNSRRIKDPRKVGKERSGKGQRSRKWKEGNVIKQRKLMES
jgi:hypothetical protein